MIYLCADLLNISYKEYMNYEMLDVFYTIIAGVCTFLGGLGYVVKGELEPMSILLAIGLILFGIGLIFLSIASIIAKSFALQEKKLEMDMECYKIEKKYHMVNSKEI